MWAFWRSATHSAVRDPEADSAQVLSAIKAWNLEQAPKRGYDDHYNKHGENKPKHESPGTGTYQSACQQKKSDHARDGSVGAAYQVQADRHVTSLLRLRRHRLVKTQAALRAFVWSLNGKWIGRVPSYLAQAVTALWAADGPSQSIERDERNKIADNLTRFDVGVAARKHNKRQQQDNHCIDQKGIANQPRATFYILPNRHSVLIPSFSHEFSSMSTEFDFRATRSLPAV
jgi:hypothetical protein